MGIPGPAMRPHIDVTHMVKVVYSMFTGDLLIGVVSTHQRCFETFTLDLAQ